MLAFSRSMRLISTKQCGVVKFFNVVKGFGFITPTEGGDDVFVHQSSIHAEGFRSLAEGEQVEFEVGTGDDGRMKATKVTGPMGEFVKGAARNQGQMNSQGQMNNGSSYGNRTGGGRFSNNNGGSRFSNNSNNEEQW